MAGVGEGRGKSDAQLCQSLLDLYDAADFVFNAILARVKSEQEKLNNLTARIVDREAQVAAIAGTKEAITLFSSAKYPQVPTENADFVPLFGGKQSKFPIATVSVDAGQYQDEEGGTLELFRFFSETNHEYWPREAQSAEGLGRVPKAVKSVADAMLFNSLELPYHLYRVVDNLAGADIVVGEEEPKHKPPPLAAPPQSVLAGDSLFGWFGAHQEFKNMGLGQRLVKFHPSACLVLFQTCPWLPTLVGMDLHVNLILYL